MRPLAETATVVAADPAAGNDGSGTLLPTGQPVTRTVVQPVYYLSEKRRVKFGEVHYFDHPRFGAIVGVWPAE